MKTFVAKLFKVLASIPTIEAGYYALAAKADGLYEKRLSGDERKVVTYYSNTDGGAEVQTTQTTWRNLSSYSFHVYYAGLWEIKYSVELSADGSYRPVEFHLLVDGVEEAMARVICKDGHYVMQGGFVIRTLAVGERPIRMEYRSPDGGIVRARRFRLRVDKIY